MVSGSHLRPLRHVSGAVAYEADGLHTGVRKSCVAHKLCQAFDSVLEGVDSRGKVLLEGVHWVSTVKKEGDNHGAGVPTADGNTNRGELLLTDDVARGLEGQLNDGLLVIRGCLMKDGKDVLPT